MTAASRPVPTNTPGRETSAPVRPTPACEVGTASTVRWGDEVRHAARYTGAVAALDEADRQRWCHLVAGGASPAAATKAVCR